MKPSAEWKEISLLPPTPPTCGQVLRTRRCGAGRGFRSICLEVALTGGKLAGLVCSVPSSSTRNWVEINYNTQSLPRHCDSSSPESSLWETLYGFQGVPHMVWLAFILAKGA